MNTLEPKAGERVRDVRVADDAQEIGIAHLGAPKRIIGGME